MKLKVYNDYSSVDIGYSDVDKGYSRSHSILGD